jgi:hypothetical protein
MAESAMAERMYGGTNPQIEYCWTFSMMEVEQNVGK